MLSGNSMDRRSGIVRGRVHAYAALILFVGGAAAHAGEEPQEPPRRKAPLFAHTNQDKILRPTIVVNHTNQDGKEPKDPGEEPKEKEDRDRSLVWDPDRPLAFVLDGQQHSHAVPALSFVPGWGYDAPVAFPMLSPGDGAGGTRSQFDMHTIPGPGVLAPLVLAGLIGTRRRRR